MQKRTRRFLFYFLVSIFLAASPVLIVYSLGYKFDLIKGAVQKTGGIFIKSKTRGLALFLDGNFAKENSLISGGALLIDLKPANHFVRLEKTGFHPWSKKVEVKPEIVTELRNIYLVPLNIIAATSTAAEQKLFLPAPKPTLSLQKNKKGSLVETKTKAVLAKNVNSFALVGSGVLFVDKNGFLARFDPGTKITETIERPGFFLDERPLIFVESVKGDVAILDPSGGLFILDASNNKITPIKGGLKKVVFDQKGEKLLLIKERGLEILWLADNTYQPFQKKGTVEIILENTDEVQNAAWFYEDGAHVAFKTGEGIFFTEVDGRGGKNTLKILSGRTDEVLTAYELPNAIFFKRGKTWYKIEI
ncbi:MAG: hypothetical protein HYW89_03895 [Candidatus Sungiibacteriota bacterium]|uniref:PEGA domain-containing protein n=1 Tax=Candidatus Sungiibacteriota bacterium TaxID=2750080 RepID=A0A7T5RJ48_9BACT|nr:MAG: hypothetical protein HYW89_03895 [Candidatus Sungbacteria bacterium]